LKKNEDMTNMEKEELIETLEKEMKGAAASMEFERAAELRDQIALIRGENPGGKRRK
jgi:excinuclease ABC subunit B